MNNRSHTPIYINMPEFLKRAREAPDMRLAGVVPMLLAYGNNGAFAWNTEAIADFLSAGRVDDLTAADLEVLRPHLLMFFVEVRNNLWAPSPDVFSMVDGNPGAQS